MLPIQGSSPTASGIFSIPALSHFRTSYTQVDPTRCMCTHSLASGAIAHQMQNAAHKKKHAHQRGRWPRRGGMAALPRSMSARALGRPGRCRCETPPSWRTHEKACIQSCTKCCNKERCQHENHWQVMVRARRKKSPSESSQRQVGAEGTWRACWRHFCVGRPQSCCWPSAHLALSQPAASAQMAL